jgi:hypothetical protein
MALADYRLCDVCECKTFYDAELNYEIAPPDHPLHPQYVPSLRLGDWAVLCVDCAKTYEVVVQPRVCAAVST